MSAQPWGLCAERARDAVGRGWIRRHAAADVYPDGCRDHCVHGRDDRSYSGAGTPMNVRYHRHVLVDEGQAVSVIKTNGTVERVS